MSGFHILTPSWTSGATATSTSNATPEVAASNLLQVQPSRKWRSAALGTLRVTLDAGTAKDWNALSLLYHNGFSGTGQIFSANILANLFTTPLYTSPTFPLRFLGDLSPFFEYHTWYVDPQIRNSRFIGLQILDASNPDGFFQAGVVVVGVVFTPKLGADLGGRSGRDDPSSAMRLLNGEAVVRPKRGMDVGSWMFPKQDILDTIRWREINRLYGSKIPMVMKWDPIVGDYAQHTFYYGRAQWRSGGPIVFANGRGLYDVEVGIEEA